MACFDFRGDLGDRRGAANLSARSGDRSGTAGNYIYYIYNYIYYIYNGGPANLSARSGDRLLAPPRGRAPPAIIYNIIIHNMYM